jgi:hypothetical protein
MAGLLVPAGDYPSVRRSRTQRGVGFSIEVSIDGFYFKSISKNSTGEAVMP